MSDTKWHATHRTRPSVEVRADDRGRSNCIFVYHPSSPGVGIGFTQREFPLFFEPIPPPVVTITLEVAKGLRCDKAPDCCMPDCMALIAAIAAAERGEAVT